MKVTFVVPGVVGAVTVKEISADASDAREARFPVPLQPEVIGKTEIAFHPTFPALILAVTVKVCPPLNVLSRAPEGAVMSIVCKLMLPSVKMVCAVRPDVRPVAVR